MRSCLEKGARRLWPRAGRALRALRFAALASLCATSWATAAPLDDMRRFVEAGQFEQAWRLALSQPQLVGDVHFDFLYGVAAINVGRVPEGLLALERHLAAVPANDRARLELARGYYLIGEYGRARSEFEFVLRYNPPAGVRATIVRFLEAMQLRDGDERRGAARLYVEAGGGRDTNVNGATFRDEVRFGFGPISISGTPSQAVADDFAQFAFGAQQLLRVSSRLSVFAGVDLDHKENAHRREFNLSSVSGSIGFTNLSGLGPVRLTLAGNALLVGGNRYRDRLSLAAESTLALGADWQMTLFGQYAEARHQGADEVRDGRSTGLGAGVTHNFSGPGAVSAGLRLSWTQEDNLRLRDDLDRTTPLVRIFASASPAEGWRVTAGATGWRETYGAADIGFGTVREDKAASVDLVVSYAVTPSWTLRVEALASEVRSNQDLYDSKRKSLALKARYQY
jgi:tetratricopeptide (TPR) repeat protein